jgi:hypothetical protein
MHHKVNTLGPSISPTPCMCQEANSLCAAKAKTGHQLVGSSIPCVYPRLCNTLLRHLPLPPLDRCSMLNVFMLFCHIVLLQVVSHVHIDCTWVLDSLLFNTCGPSSVIPHLGLVFLHCTKYYICHNIMNLLLITIWSNKWVPIANKAENCLFRQIHGTRYIHGITRPIG